MKLRHRITTPIHGQLIKTRIREITSLIPYEKSEHLNWFLEDWILGNTIYKEYTFRKLKEQYV
jgi:hypothetical protein